MDNSKKEPMEDEPKVSVEDLKEPKALPALLTPIKNPQGAGRPTKAALKATRKPGRPKETEGRIAEFKERLLATKGNYVIDKVLQIALEDGNPGQMAALKMCMDRVLPVSLFEKGAGGKPSVQINIMNATVDNPDQTIDIDVGQAEEEE